MWFLTARWRPVAASNWPANPRPRSCQPFRTETRTSSAWTCCNSGEARLGLRRRGRQTNKLAGTGERQFDIGADILPAQVIQKAGLVHHKERLSMRTAEDQMLPARLQPFVQVF